MTKYGKKYKSDKQVIASDLFSEHNFKTNSSSSNNSVRENRKRNFAKNLSLFLLVSMMLGVVFVVPPVLAVSTAAQVGAPVADVWKNLPSQLDGIVISERNVLYDSQGNVFAEVWDENRVTLKNLNEISDYAEKALVSTEDRRFYEHKGIDIQGTARAALSGRGGGSGLTQQLVKNLQFYNLAGKDKKDQAIEATLERKIRELKYSLEYEKTHSKDDILLSYFNVVSFGDPNIYSIESASQYFFGIPAKELNLSQSALLVGTVQNPVKYSLSKPENEEEYKSRQKTVLNSMVSTGEITQQEADDAYNEPINFVFKKVSSGNCASSVYPFYCDYVMDYMRSSKKLGETSEERSAILSKGGLHIETHMDPAAMKIAEEQLEKDYGNLNEVATPVAIVEPGTGGVVAMAANRDYGSGEGQTTINLPLNPEASGSTFKMITLGASLANGTNEGQLSFSSSCPWRKRGFDTPSGGVKNSVSCAWQGGAMDYREATAKSSNTWFSELISRVSIPKTQKFASSIGLSDGAEQGINERSTSYTLGVTKDSPVALAAAFATFANEGIYCKPTPVKSYAYADGKSPVLPDNYDPASDTCSRVLSPKDSGVVLKAMQANVSGEFKGTTGHLYSTPGFDTVGKTGTNQLSNSTWVHLSQNYSIFANQYNPANPTDSIGTVKFRGRASSWQEHSSAISASDIMKQLIEKDGGVAPLKYNSSDDSMTPVPVELREFFTVPSFMGMNPEQALATAQSLGIKVNVSKDVLKAPEGYSSGVVVAQSIEPGKQLPVGTKKELILNISE